MLLERAADAREDADSSSRRGSSLLSRHDISLIQSAALHEVLQQNYMRPVSSLTDEEVQAATFHFYSGYTDVSLSGCEGKCMLEGAAITWTSALPVG